MALVTGVARSIPRKVIYLLIAWILMVSYQIFTRTALITLASSFEGSAPSVASLISSNAGTTSFVCSFAWMFVLSALISIIMFGKERRLTIQFLITLALTLISSALLGLLSTVGLELANPNFLTKSGDLLFGNVFFAFFYLALPFIFMVAVDLKWMKIKK
jgi:hypothetical protein